VLGELQLAGDTAHLVQTRLRFAAVSPQAANLALNTVEELRTDWVNLLLGGENSRWSNFELAEAMARLLTARAVTGEFADSIASPRGPRSTAEVVALLDERQLHPGVRRRVLHAMEMVATSGTARALAGPLFAARQRVAQIEPGSPYELFVFAKTGTPAVEKFLTSNQQRLVLQLYRAGDLRWNAATRKVEVRPVAEERVRSTYGEPTLRWIRTDVLEPIERDPAAFTATDGRLPDHPLFLDANGRLRARELPDLRVSRQGGVLILGFLAVPAQVTIDAGRRDDWISACSLDPGLRTRILRVPPADLLDPASAVAISVAVYVDDLPVGQGSGLAIDLARTVVAPVTDYIEKEIRRKVAGRERR
jgi:hypothetical protein